MGDVKVTLNESPSQEITAATKQEFNVTDAKGRVLTLRKPNVLAHYRLVKMLGDAARNSAYLSLVSPLTYLLAIDGEAILPPNTERELDSLIQMLDDEGVMALVEGMQEHFSAATSKEEQEQVLKNS